MSPPEQPTNEHTIGASLTLPAAPVARSVTSNALWNWAGMAASVLAGFVVAPCLVRGLGETDYGFWILIGSFTGAFGLLDFGVRGSVGRSIAFLRSTHDYASVNSVLSTALLLLSAVAVFAFLIIWLFQDAFFYFYSVPRDEAETVRTTLMIVALNLGITFPANVFDATLWAGQRFDILNRIDIPIAAARVAFTYLLVYLGQGLVALALMTLFLTVIVGVCKARASFQHDSRLAIHLKFANFEAARALYGYGIWLFLMSLASFLLPQIGPLIVGSKLAVAMVTPFSVAARLVAYASQIVTSATGVLTPVMTDLHASDNKPRFRYLFVKASMYCFTLALFLSGLLLVLGKSFISLWINDRVAASAAPVLCALAIGELIPMSQSITCSAVLGMSRHRFWAIMSIVQLAVSVVAGITMANRYGLLGVALALAISSSLCRGLIQAISPCRILGLSARTYFTQCLAPPIVSAAAPTALLALMTWTEPPRTWLTLITFATVYGLTFFAAALLLPAYADLRGRLRGVADHVRACWSW